MENIKKELLQETNNKGFKTLHNCFGYDYNKPYKIYKISGKFTLNAIAKMILPDGFNVYNSKIVLCLKNANQWQKELAAVEMLDTNTINIEYNYYSFGGGFDHFYKKGRFDDCRKDNNCVVYIIAQLSEYLKKPAEYKPDYTKERFNYISHNTCNVVSGVSCISSIKLSVNDHQGEKITRNIIGRIIYASNLYNGRYKQDISEYIDKSGYFVDFKRDNLKSRAAALRAEREKAAFDIIDNSEKINTLYNLIQARKAEIIALFQAAETSADFDRISKIMYHWGAFPDIVADFEKLKARDAEKKYSSIAAFDTAYNNIVSNIEKNRGV